MFELLDLGYLSDCLVFCVDCKGKEGQTNISLDFFSIWKFALIRFLMLGSSSRPNRSFRLEGYHPKKFIFLDRGDVYIFEIGRFNQLLHFFVKSLHHEGPVTSNRTVDGNDMLPMGYLQ